MKQPASETPVTVTVFSRIEDKYILPKRLLPDFLSLVDTQLDRSYGSASAKEAGTSGNQSIYFDSGELDCFQHHFAKLEKRFKLRIRRYHVNGQWEANAVFVESKFKINGISSKQRFLLTPEAFNGLMVGREIEITPELLEANSTLKKDKLLKRVNELNFLLRGLIAKPKLIVNYQRTAFAKDDLRITIDQNIQTQSLGVYSPLLGAQIRSQEFWNQARQMPKSFNNHQNVLIEIKHSGSHPEWFDQFMNKHSILPVSFSKYCYGITRCLEESLQVPDSNNILLQSQPESLNPVPQSQEAECSLAVL